MPPRAGVPPWLPMRATARRRDAASRQAVRGPAGARQGDRRHLPAAHCDARPSDGLTDEGKSSHRTPAAGIERPPRSAAPGRRRSEADLSTRVRSRARSKETGKRPGAGNARMSLMQRVASGLARQRRIAYTTPSHAALAADGARHAPGIEASQPVLRHSRWLAFRREAANRGAAVQITTAAAWPPS